MTWSLVIIRSTIARCFRNCFYASWKRGNVYVSKFYEREREGEMEEEKDVLKILRVSRIHAHQPRTPIRVISQTLHLGSETIGASTGRFLWAERNVSSTEEMLLNGGWMLAFFAKSQHDRFFESLGCRAGHILDRLAMRDSPESRCV